MELTGLAYICLFLPGSVALYYLAPRRFRPAAMAVLSVVFLLLRARALALWAVAVVGAAYACALWIYRSRYSLARKRVGLTAGLLLCAGLFGGQVWQMGLGLNTAIMATVVLSAFSCLMDLYRGDINELYPFPAFAAYCLFFGRVIYGPLVGADEFVLQLRRVRPSARRMGGGVVSLFTGLAQLLIPAGSLDMVRGHILGAPPPEQSLLMVVMLLLATAFGWYFRIAGYANMAVGTGLLFGIDLPRNHAYPIGASSLASFFNRFLITQNAYARAYLAPAIGGGNRVGSGHIVAVVLTSVFAGLWLGLPGGAVWGAFWGLLIWAEGRLPVGRRRSGPDYMRHTVIFLVGNLSFILLLPAASPGYFTELSALVSRCFYMPVYTDLAVSMLVYFAPLFGIALLLVTRLLQNGSAFLKGRLPGAYNAAVLLWGVFMIVISLSAMVQDGGWSS